MNNFNPEPSTGDSPKVLLTDTNRWASSARMAIALADAGCQISALCPVPNHPLLKTRAVGRTYCYSGLRPLESLAAAIEAVQPDVVVPSCDRGVGHLHELYARVQSREGGGSKLATLIERSLGSPTSYSTVSSRYDLLAIACEEGVRVPNTSRANIREEMESWQARESFPWVLKADGTWGGGGVKIVHSAADIERSFAEVARLFRRRRAIKRLVVNRDSFGLRSWWNQSEHEVIVQSYIQGRAANCAIFCWKGRVLAGFGVEVVSSEGLTGPASVVRVADNAEMMFAAERIASRLGLSGFYGLDFMIEEGSNAAYLIELNPRATPLCHLRLGTGRDMAGALWAQLQGKSLCEAPSVTQSETIAYFPQRADAKVPPGCFPDIPQGEPELLEELLEPWPDRTFLFRLFTRLKRNSTDDEALHKNHPQACKAPEHAGFETPSNAASKMTAAANRAGRHDLS